jgi:hypothetical protein
MLTHVRTMTVEHRHLEIELLEHCGMWTANIASQDPKLMTKLGGHTVTLTRQPTRQLAEQKAKEYIDQLLN